MAPKSRVQAGAGARKGKTARRAVRPKSGSGVPILPIVVGSILAVLAIAMVVWIIYLGRPQGPSTTPTVAGIPCDHLEHTQIHYHAALQIIYKGVVTDLPANTGIDTDSAGNVTCYYWLHEFHTANGQGPRKLDATHVASITIGPGDKVVTYVDLGDGKGPQVQTGDPSAIVLKSHEVITIEITPPAVTPPPSFTFPSGL